ncbi:MAG: CBS domain-containing protein [Actinobacteria bacterium]|nr:MAG: CBS domain-containing protein [Actinomycetota bacterium]
MKISEIMTQAAVTDSAEDTLTEACERMRHAQTSSVLIMDDDRLVGIITERDIVKTVAQGLDPKETRVKDIMTTDIITIGPMTTLKEAANIMATKWIRHLPIVEGSKVVGMISQRDLTGVLAEALHEPERLNQLIQASMLVRERRLKRIEAGDYD